MLFTRCPECDTTFRVTDETLKKASGQVRCGRCASVFNAYSELQDPATKSPGSEARGRGRRIPTPAPPPEAPKRATAGPGTLIPLEPKTPGIDSGLGVGTSIADVVAEANVAAAEAAAEGRADEKPRASHAISATEVDRVLTDDQVRPVPYVWLHPEPRRRSRWWAAGSALALVVLGTQAVHHFRSHIAG